MSNDDGHALPPPPGMTFADLRALLFESIRLLRVGKIDVKTGNAIAKSAETIIKSVDTQVEYEKLRLDSKVPAHLPAMDLVPKIRHDGK